MFSKTSEYALQALSRICQKPEEWHEVGVISKALGIPGNYLSKILGQLAKLGVLESRKGWGGGFRLARDPAKISLSEVIQPLEGAAHPKACAFGLDECSDADPCPLHDYWKEISRIHEEMLENTTLADLVPRRLRARKRPAQKAGKGIR